MENLTELEKKIWKTLKKSLYKIVPQKYQKKIIDKEKIIHIEFSCTTYTKRFSKYAYESIQFSCTLNGKNVNLTNRQTEKGKKLILLTCDLIKKYKVIRKAIEILKDKEDVEEEIKQLQDILKQSETKKQQNK